MKRLLFVEDDEIDQLAIRRSLPPDNGMYEYQIAGSVREARNMLSQAPFDIVIIDFNLRDGTGFDVFDFVTGVPYIVLTGEGSEEIAVEAIKAGASDYVVKESDGRHFQLLPTVIDSVLNRFEMEKKLDMLLQAMMSIRDAVYITDLATNVIYINDAFTHIYGYTKQDIIGRSSRMLWDSSKPNTDPETGDVFHKKKDGTLFPALLSKSAVKDSQGREVNLITVVHDMSDRNKMENALRDAIKKFSALLDQKEKMYDNQPRAAN